MKLKPNFLRTIDENHNNANWDVNVMCISSRKPVNANVSIVVVDGVEHHVYTSELKELVNLPNSSGY